MERPTSAASSEPLVVEGRRLETRRIPARVAERPTLVLLHEGLGSIATWRDVPERLAALTGCAVFVYSRYGYGGSEGLEGPRPLDYMEREGERSVPALLAAAGIERPILIGHSDGASIALVAAARAPQAILGVVLEAPHVFVEDLSVRSIAQAKEAFENGDLRARLARHHDDVDGAFYGWNQAWLDPRFRAWNIERYLPDVRCPVLVVQGEDDPYGTWAQVDAIARGVADVESLRIASCGHSPHREAPEATLAAIAAFVERVAAGAGLGCGPRKGHP